MYDICFVFILFFIYAMGGYLIEVTAVSLSKDELELNRGFLFGPYIPIFGFGAIGMIYLLTDYQNDLFELFVMGALLCTILEYLTSLIMEKMFHLRWWDYSTKKFNINGRVCLENSIYFGLAGILLIKVINPILVNFLSIIPKGLFIVIVLIIATIFLLDVILSFSIVNNIKNNFDKYCYGDNTQAIKEEIRKSLEKISKLQTHVYKAFPNVQSIKDPEIFKKYKNLSNDIREEIKKQKYNKKISKNKSK